METGGAVWALAALLGGILGLNREIALKPAACVRMRWSLSVRRFRHESSGWH
jgi:hypothetical protein